MEAQREHVLLSLQSLESNGSKGQRSFSGVCLSISSARFPEALKRIRDFQRELMTLMETPKNSQNQVYQLSISFFPLSFEV
jgi:uncharacterized protein (TIGR02147 family)